MSSYECYCDGIAPARGSECLGCGGERFRTIPDHVLERRAALSSELSPVIRRLKRQTFAEYMAEKHPKRFGPDAASFN